LKKFAQKNKGLLILLGIILVSLFFCSALPASLQWFTNKVLSIPVAFRPVITLPGEALNPKHPLFTLFGQQVFLTNTLAATWVSYAILLLIALLGRRGLKQEVPTGIGNAVEAVIEVLYNISEQTVGHKYVRKIFPVAATIFLLIFAANIVKMIPGFESVGIIHHAREGVEGYDVKELSNSGIYYLVNTDEAIAGGEHASGEGAGEGGEEHSGGYVVTPFLRAAATDINFPLGLAIISFVTIQAFGLMSLGGHYIGKFINVDALARGGMGFMDFGVGLLELILEPIKMVSLTFRLLGNIFGGAVLVIVVSTLVPYLLPTGLYVYEIFVGIIQAYVFFMLTLVFSAIAMIGHDTGEEHQ
jgi:F-type H+-transporting ATPase subunit a